MHKRNAIKLIEELIEVAGRHYWLEDQGGGADDKEFVQVKQRLAGLKKRAIIHLTTRKV